MTTQRRIESVRRGDFTKPVITTVVKSAIVIEWDSDENDRKFKSLHRHGVSVKFFGRRFDRTAKKSPWDVAGGSRKKVTRGRNYFRPAQKTRRHGRHG